MPGETDGTASHPLGGMDAAVLVDDLWVQGANMRFITLLGTKSFMNIIGSVERVNPLAPRTSQKRKGS